MKTVETEVSDWMGAAYSRNSLRSADSVRLEMARWMLCTDMLVFDEELAEAARAVGMNVPSF